MVEAIPRQDPVGHLSRCRPGLPLLVLTDLDGTLLDHDSYSFSAAQPALQRLRQLHIPVIPVTSKTLAELQPLMRALENPHPCIAENGGLIAIPPHYFRGLEDCELASGYRVIRLSAAYADILNSAHRLRAEQGFRFRGFGDMDAAEIAARTDLTPAQAQRAKRRLSTEPLLWLDSDAALKRFRDALAASGLQLVRGGRFWHLMGAHDKASAVQRLCEHYRANGLRRFVTVALGDSPNDIAMLRAADIPVVIRSQAGDCLAVPERRRVLCSELPGAGGWNQMMLGILDEAAQRETRRQAEGERRG
jgi:mannosyl-3-phosphoglycerate phosphatase